MPILDLEKSEAPVSYSCETVIIGAGAVGITMAVELSRRGQNVILLEAGGMSLEMQSQAIFRNARSSGFKLDGLHAGRFRLLGGTTNFWGGQLVPFDPIVFERRPWIDSEGWPIDHNELEQYYARVMSLVGMDGAEETDQAVWQRAATAPPPLDDDLQLFLTRWVKTPNFAKLFRADLAGTLFKTIIHANVVGLEPNASNDRIARVHVRTLGGRKATIAAHRIILACGTIEIARLLMLPFMDGRKTPWSDNPWLGRAYLDHLDTTVAEVKPRKGRAFHNTFENLFFDGYKYNPKIKLGEKVQRERNLLGVAGAFIFRTSYEENAQNAKLFLRSVLSGKLPENFWQFPAHAMALSRIALPLAYRYFRDNRTFHPSGSPVIFRVTSEQVPQAASRISLREERDALGLPLVDVDWRIDGRELETIAYFSERVRDSLHAAQLADLEIHPALLERDPRFLEGASDTYHQMGGARMGHGPRDGVVDRNLQVFGTSGLYVAGAAVIPSSGFPNCTLTAMALGIRLCDRLIAENQRVTQSYSVSTMVPA
jgi:choline dehydrogenase-like flavoprotein